MLGGRAFEAHNRLRAEMSMAEVFEVAEKAADAARWWLEFEECSQRRNTYILLSDPTQEGYQLIVFGGPPIRDMTFQTSRQYANRQAVMDAIKTKPLNVCRRLELHFGGYHSAVDLDSGGRVVRVSEPRWTD